MATDVHIRKCQAGDAAFLARAILIAGRAHVSKGIWEIILNMTEEKCLRFLELATVTEIPHLFHYSCSFIAKTAADIPVGSLGGYDPQKFLLSIFHCFNTINHDIQYFAMTSF